MLTRKRQRLRLVSRRSLLGNRGIIDQENINKTTRDTKKTDPSQVKQRPHRVAVARLLLGPEGSGIARNSLKKQGRLGFRGV